MASAPTRSTSPCREMTHMSIGFVSKLSPLSTGFDEAKLCSLLTIPFFDACTRAFANVRAEVRPQTFAAIAAQIRNKGHNLRAKSSSRLE